MHRISAVLLTVVRRPAWWACLSLLCASIAPVAAQTPTVFEEQGQLIRASRKVSSLTSSLFGDQVSLYNGTVSFTQTDVSLPGNNALAVQVGRRLSTGASRISDNAFGDWELDIPHLKGVFSAKDGWHVETFGVAANKYKRCSNFERPAEARTQTGNQIVEYWEYWFGNHLYAPGSGEQELLRWGGATARPTDGQTYPAVTKGGWVFRCITTPLPRGQAGEGFIGIAPDGTQYRFDWLVARNYPSYRTASTGALRTSGASVPRTNARPTPGEENAAAGLLLARNEVWLLPTLVTDRFGNTVTYTYSASRPWRLESIAASDGRTITLGYDASTDLVRSVFDGTRTWNYSYTAGTGGNRLTTVTQPDAAQWQFSGANLQFNPTYTAPPGVCDSQGAFTSVPETMTMVHPSGAVGSFTFTQMLRARSHVQNLCVWAPGAGPNWYPVFYLVRGLTQKTLSGPGLPASTWTYTWGAPNGSLSPCNGCAETVTMSVTDPRGFVTRYTHGNRWMQNEGQLLRVEEGWNGQSALRVKDFRYRQATGGAYPAEAGTVISGRSDAAFAVKNLPLDLKQITQQGTLFSWEVTGFDTWVRPTVVSKASSLGYQRTESTAYSDNLNKWVTGQRASLTVSGGGLAQPVVTESITYDPTTALPVAQYVNGRLDRTFDYHSDGTLKWWRDGAGHQTSYQNYMRGLAQSITYADSTGESAVVNNLGLVTSWTNAAGTTTQYGYDAMGRLSLVTYPPESGGGYYATTLSFQKVAYADRGLEGGHWQQTITTGNNVARRYFDALWRERLRYEYDAANEGGTSSAVETRYDIDGRKTFETYPQRSLSGVGAGVSGHWWEYDALGREQVHRQSSELNPSLLNTVTEYLGSFQKRVTNPRGYASVYSYQAWDEPSEDHITGISAPEGVTVSIPRDTLSKPSTITRSGGGASVTRRYVYDFYQRLCKTVEPESGATVQGYDAANNLAWRAGGQNFPGPGCETQVAGSSLVNFGYDPRNRLTTTTYGDGSQNITRSYTPDGLLQQIVASDPSNPITWNYYYNNRRLLVREQYAWAAGVVFGSWEGWNFAYDINAHGHVASLADAWGTMAYAPNALGQPTQVSGYASGVSYHPNGAVASYTLANGITHSMTQNLRGLPELMQDGGVVRDRYAYDGNGNVTSITDEAQAGVNTRSMPWYDGLDRLRQANGPWGSGSFSYDALDNLISSTVGGRSLSHNIDAATNRLTSLTGSQSIGIGYDANGNITSRGSQGFVFDIGNRMRSAVGKASYVYDGHGRRNLIWLPGDYKHQAYTRDGKLRFEWQQSQMGRRNVYLGDRLIAEVAETGWVTTFVHTDALGSPVAKTNSGGGLVSRTRYEPYGATVAGSTNPTGIGFTGHVNDPDTGLVYMQQRYYDPIAGRFLSVDPVTADAKTGDSFNRYVYGNSNPYKFKDPDGRQSTDANNAYQAPLAPLYQMLKATFGGLVNERPGTVPVNGVSTERTLAVSIVEVTHSSSVSGSSLFVGLRSSPGYALQSSVVADRTIGDSSGLTVKVSASAGLGSGLTGSASASTGDGTHSGGLQVGGGLIADAGKATFGIRPPAVTAGWTFKLSADEKPTSP